MTEHSVQSWSLMILSTVFLVGHVASTDTIVSFAFLCATSVGIVLTYVSMKGDIDAE